MEPTGSAGPVPQGFVECHANSHAIKTCGPEARLPSAQSPLDDQGNFARALHRSMVVRIKN